MHHACRECIGCWDREPFDEVAGSQDRCLLLTAESKYLIGRSGVLAVVIGLDCLPLLPFYLKNVTDDPSLMIMIARASMCSSYMSLLCLWRSLSFALYTTLSTLRSIFVYYTLCAKQKKASSYTPSTMMVSSVQRWPTDWKQRYTISVHSKPQAYCVYNIQG